MSLGFGPSNVATKQGDPVMLADDLDSLLRARGVTAKKEIVGVFGDLCWDTPSELLRTLHQQDPAVLYENEQRYVVLHRFPDGIRFFAAPAPVGTLLEGAELWDVGVLADAVIAAEFGEKWLAGCLRRDIQTQRAPAPWNRPS
jgi:hypothetical protein